MTCLFSEGSCTFFKIVESNVLSCKTKGMIKHGCWVEVNPLMRSARVLQDGVCRRVCKHRWDKLEIMETIFCKNGAALDVEYDFLVNLKNADISTICCSDQICMGNL